MKIFQLLVLAILIGFNSESFAVEEVKNIIPPVLQVTLLPFTVDEQSEIQFNNSTLSVINGHYRNAKEIVQDILEVTPNHNLARKRLIELLIQEKDYISAKEEIKKGIKICKNCYYYRKFLANILESEGDYNLAIDTMLKINSEYKYTTEFKEHLAKLYIKTKKYNLAEKFYTELVVIDNSTVKWVLGLAMSQDGLGKHPQAIKAYSTILNTPEFDTATVDFIEHRVKILTT